METTPIRFINIKEVCRRTCLGKTTVLNWEANGNFPRAVRISSNKRVWYEGDINAWILSKRAEIIQIGQEIYDANS